MGVGVVGADRDRAIEAHGRTGRAVERAQRGAAIVQGLDMARLDGERPVISGDRLLVAPEFLQHDAEIRQRLHRDRVEPVGRFDQSKRLVIAALLMPQHAEQVQRIEMHRTVVKNLAVEQLGGGKVAGLVRFDGPAEQVAKIEGLLGRAHRDNASAAVDRRQLQRGTPKMT